MIAYFNQGFTLELTEEQARLAYHPGRCDDDVEALSRDPAIRKALDSLPVDKVREELRDHGWDEEELNDHEANLQRILWLAAGNIADELDEQGAGG